MAEYRRSMRALERVAASAARQAEATARRHLHVVPAPEDKLAPVKQPVSGEPRPENVVSLAARRARRAGHPAGSGRER